MLGTLVESSPKRVRRRLSALVSISTHVIVLTAAASAARPMRGEPEPDQRIIWHPPTVALPECRNCSSGTHGGPRGGTSRDIPPLPGSVTADFTLEIPENAGPPAPGPVISTKEWRGGFADRSSDTGPLVPGREGVDREVVPLPTNPAPRYPAELRAAGIQGSVFARFVVDTAGRVRMETVSVDASDHPRFAEAVIEALRRSRYTPAELRGRKVPQLVVQPFVFVLRD